MRVSLSLRGGGGKSEIECLQVTERERGRNKVCESLSGIERLQVTNGVLVSMELKIYSKWKKRVEFRDRY